MAIIIHFSLSSFTRSNPASLIYSPSSFLSPCASIAAQSHFIRLWQLWNCNQYSDCTQLRDSNHLYLLDKGCRHTEGTKWMWLNECQGRLSKSWSIFIVLDVVTVQMSTAGDKTSSVYLNASHILWAEFLRQEANFLIRQHAAHTLYAHLWLTNCHCGWRERKGKSGSNREAADWWWWKQWMKGGRLGKKGWEDLVTTQKSWNIVQGRDAHGWCDT